MASSGPVTWIQSTYLSAGRLFGKAVVAGNNAYHGPLWVARGSFGIEKVPGKLSLVQNILAVNHKAAVIPWEGKEILVDNFEVCCALPESITWIQDSAGNVPAQAVLGGWGAPGEPLYIGRVHHAGALIPGVIQQSKGVLTISNDGELLTFQTYEVLCTI